MFFLLGFFVAEMFFNDFEPVLKFTDVFLDGQNVELSRGENGWIGSYPVRKAIQISFLVLLACYGVVLVVKFVEGND